ncbi:MAG: hypothetical protein IJJ23_12070 [Clostridia bacterium]|nr:hypothetical protein [Clostridia bacterium]
MRIQVYISKFKKSILCLIVFCIILILLSNAHQIQALSKIHRLQNFIKDLYISLDQEYAAPKVVLGSQGDFWIVFNNGKLYFYQSQNSSRNYVSSFLYSYNGKTFSKLYSPGFGYDKCDCIGMIDNRIYFLRYSVSSNSTTIISHNLENGESKELYHKDTKFIVIAEHIIDDCLYVELMNINADTFYIKIDQERILEIQDKSLMFKIQNNSFYLDRRTGITENSILSIQNDNSNNSISHSLGMASSSQVISFMNGTMIHNEGGNDILYFIDENALIHKVFNVDCMFSSSKLCWVKNNLILSLVAYNGFNDIFPIKTDDTGTYRIDVYKFSIQRISDTYYEKLFVLDDNRFLGITPESEIEVFDLTGVPLYQVRH